MEVTLTIPDKVAEEIQNVSSTPLPRRLLELAVIQAHEDELITERDVMDVLGFESREDLHAFFKRRDVRSGYTMADLERDRATLDALLGRR